MESLEEFKRRIRKVNHPRKYKVNNSLGVYDAYKYYRKNKPKEKQFVLTESQYFSIIRRINLLLIEELLQGNEITLPYHMGKVELRKYNKSIRIGENGEVFTNLPIDWNKTLELWYNDSDAYHNKTLVRMEENEIFKIYYNKASANYENKSFYEFIFNKDLKSRLKQKIKEGVIEAHLLKRKEKLNG